MRKPVYVICEQLRCIDSIIPELAKSNISRLQLHVVSEAELAVFSLTWLQTPKTGFLVMRLNSVFSWSNRKISTTLDLGENGFLLYHQELISNYTHIYRKLNRGLRDIPQF